MYPAPGEIDTRQKEIKKSFRKESLAEKKFRCKGVMYVSIDKPPTTKM